MKRIAPTLGVALAIVVAVSAAYYWFVGVGAPISRESASWALFGDYFGGVAGPLLTFVSILLVAITVRQQYELAKKSEDEGLKRDLLLHIDRANEAIDHWLGRPIPCHYDREVEFGDVVWGLVPAKDIDGSHLKRANGRLYQILGLYCTAVSLYRDNVNPYFVFTYHRDRALALVTYMELHTNELPHMAGPSLFIMRSQLEGRANVA